MEYRSNWRDAVEFYGLAERQDFAGWDPSMRCSESDSKVEDEVDFGEPSDEPSDDETEDEVEEIEEEL